MRPRSSSWPTGRRTTTTSVCKGRILICIWTACRHAKPISEQVKGMSDGQLESYFANLGKKKGARPAETDE